MDDANARGPCVLIVDDEEDIRETLREVVEMAGCTAVTAANGAEALALLATWRPCLVIVDIVMPVMSGGDMIAAMRADPVLASIPVVVSTSSPDQAPPGVPVIAKPNDIRLIWAWMRRTCACTASTPR